MPSLVRLRPSFGALALLLVTLSGCMLQNAGPTEKLRDAVNGMTDELRWNRIDLAVDRVLPTYRERFRMTRLKWGKAIQIADVEVIHMKLAEDSDKASSILTVRWYGQAETIVRETTLQQNWVRSGKAFYLSGEKVVEGDDRLIAMPEPPPQKSPQESPDGAPHPQTQ